jgi:hypothetical protein
MSSARRKPEDSAEGCRVLEQADRFRAAATPNPHTRECLERSADAWNARAALLDRLKNSFNERAAEIVEVQPARRTRRAMAKGQARSNEEVRKPKAETPKKPTSSKPSRKTLGISTT